MTPFSSTPLPHLALVSLLVCERETARTLVGAGPLADPAAVAKQKTPHAKCGQNAAARAAHQECRDRRVGVVVVAAVAVEGGRAVVERRYKESCPGIGHGRGMVMVVFHGVQWEQARKNQRLQGETQLAKAKSPSKVDGDS